MQAQGKPEIEAPPTSIFRLGTETRLCSDILQATHGVRTWQTAPLAQDCNMYTVEASLQADPGAVQSRES
jgi:hypothetical protein